MEDEKRKPKISKRAFWDTNFELIDWEASSTYLTIRIIERGTFNDLIEIIRFYGKDRIKKELTAEKILPERTFYFILTFFKLKKDNLKCSISKL